MFNREKFSTYFNLNIPASTDEITAAETKFGFPLPAPYTALLAITDGLSCQGNLVLLEARDLVSRNADYEVSEYLPGYIMIGDDSGGIGIVMNLHDEIVYEVDMGVMDATDLRKSADNLEQLLFQFGGKTLGERR